MNLHTNSDLTRQTLISTVYRWKHAEISLCLGLAASVFQRQTPVLWFYRWNITWIYHSYLHFFSGKLLFRQFTAENRSTYVVKPDQISAVILHSGIYRWNLKPLHDHTYVRKS